MMSQTPAIPATLSADGATVSFRCDHCRATHTHGSAGIADRSNPHRLAHCTKPGSPYAATGYVLALPPPETIAARQAVIGDTMDPVEAARRLKAAGYDTPHIDRVLKGEPA